MKNIFLIFFFFYSSLSFSQDTLQTAKEDAYAFYSSQHIPIDTLASQYLYYKTFDWLGTKYKYAGESKDGIDCSGFVSEIYKDVYCIPLQGGSKDIYSMVKPVEKENLQEGDLVFFKIKGGQISHVGVYLRNNKFAHASVHQGVVISDLDEPYYKKYFFGGGRIVYD